MSRMPRSALLVSVFVLCVAALHPHEGDRLQARQASGAPAWFCPMHADVTSSAPGQCSKCGMALIQGNPFDTREYQVEARTSPAAVHAGVPFTLHVGVREPAEGRLVKSFETVHDKRYHLFVISQDMSAFQHIHPDQQPDGSWTLDVTVPKPGYYWLLSDFVPTGGSPQFLARPLITARFSGDAASQGAHLTPDIDAPKTVDGITARVSVEPATLVAGQYGHLTFTLDDAATGEPVTDLQPYLGAFGHTLIMREDLSTAVHSHPSPGPGSDISTGRGGPAITFEGYLPQPGVYRAWTQFLRRDKLSTFAFTFRVLSLDEAFRR